MPTDHVDPTIIDASNLDNCRLISVHWNVSDMIQFFCFAMSFHVWTHSSSKSRRDEGVKLYLLKYWPLNCILYASSVIMAPAIDNRGHTYIWQFVKDSALTTAAYSTGFNCIQVSVEKYCGINFIRIKKVYNVYTLYFYLFTIIKSEKCFIWIIINETTTFSEFSMRYM